MKSQITTLHRVSVPNLTIFLKSPWMMEFSTKPFKCFFEIAKKKSPNENQPWCFSIIVICSYWFSTVCFLVKNLWMNLKEKITSLKPLPFYETEVCSWSSRAFVYTKYEYTRHVNYLQFAVFNEFIDFYYFLYTFPYNIIYSKYTKYTHRIYLRSW